MAERKINDGGPAFPAQVATQHYVESDAHGMARAVAVYAHVPGMSLRDYFAAAALQGFVANQVFFGSHFQGSAESAAEFAYQAADAMLQERAKAEPIHAA